MSSVTRQGQFLSLIDKFRSRDLPAASFCARFTKLWMQDRDSAYAKKAAWPQPYDEILLVAWQRGEIADSEFQREYAKLWGYAEEVDFHTMIDKIHSACSVFSPSPELQGEIDEEQLRHDVKESLTAYEKQSKPLAQAAL